VTALGFLPTAEGGELFVGGVFSEAGGIPSPGAARWTPTGWKPAGTGLVNTFQAAGSPVSAFLLTREPIPRLLVAGAFDRYTGSTDRFFNGPSIAAWNGSGWQPLRQSQGGTNGVHGSVAALGELDTPSGHALFVGGQFTDIYTDRTLRRMPFVARHDGHDWAPAGQTLDRPIHRLVLAAPGGAPTNLYAAGSFQHGGAHRLGGILRIDQGRLLPVGGGVRRAFPNTPPEVHALLATGRDAGASLLVGGAFDLAGDTPAASIARWDGQAWTALEEGVRLPQGPGVVHALHELPASLGGGIAVGGYFTTAGTLRSANLARWTGTNWSSLDPGFSGTVLALAVHGPDDAPGLYAGGDLVIANGTTTPSRGVAAWDGQRWQAVRGRRRDSPPGTVFALAAHDDGTGPALYAAGDFSRTPDGGTLLNGVARWDGRDWTYLTGPAGSPAFARVTRLLSHTGGYEAGLFAIVIPRFEEGLGSDPRLARWDGLAWELFEHSRVGEPGELGDLLPAEGDRLWLGGGKTQFEGQLWRWGASTPPCP
jgi:hypothetical protein